MVPPPAALTEYQLERRFWQEFGAPQPPLDDWPRRKVAEYVCIQRALDEAEREQQQRANSSGLPSGGASPARPAASAQVTEESFQALRAQAKPPPMPPGPPPPA